MNALRLLALIFIFVLEGCAGEMSWNLATAPFLPIPIPWYDVKFHSVSYYKKKYGVDLLAINHDMQYQVDRNHRSIDALNSLFGKVNLSFNGERIPLRAPYDDKYFRGMKKVGPNDYVVGLRDVPPINIQEDYLWCWAACLSYFISKEYGAIVDQRHIVDEIKQGKPSSDQAGSIIDIMRALGYSNLKVSSDGGRELVSALSLGHVAIMGLKDKKHVVIVVAARFSFVDPVNPTSTPKDGVAFSEITYLDPAEKSLKRPGQAEEISSEDLEKQVSFILTQDFSGQ